MKKRVVSLLAIWCLLCSICVPAFAEDGTFEYTDTYVGDGICLMNYHGSGGEIVIPSEYDGKKVLEVGSLGGSKSVTKVTVSEGITTLGNAFEDMTALQEVILPHSLREIHAFAFQNTGIQELKLPEGLDMIAIDSICCNPKLKTISIPASVTAVHTAAIWNNPALQAFSVAPENPNWKTVADGVLLMRKDSREVFSCAGGAVPKVFTVPDEVAFIKSTAMIGCPNLEVLILPKSINGMDGDVLDNCPKLKAIYAKADSFYLAPYAFHRIPGQVTVYCNASPDMEPSENFTVKPYIEGMEKEVFAAQTTAGSGQTASNAKKPASKSKTEPSTAPTPETTAVEVSTETFTRTELEETVSVAESISAETTEDTAARAPKHLGWIIGGAVGTVLLAAGVTLVILMKKGKLPIKKAS